MCIFVENAAESFLRLIIVFVCSFLPKLVFTRLLSSPIPQSSKLITVDSTVGVQDRAGGKALNNNNDNNNYCTNCDCCFWHSGDHPNDSIIENGKNTEKSPGDLRRLAVTKTPVKNHQLTLM